MDGVWSVILILFLISVLSGLIGTFVIWNGLAYFAESLAHVSLLGVSIAVIVQCDYSYMIMLVAAIFSLIFVKIKLVYSVDSILSIITSSIIAIAMIFFPWDHSLESIFTGNLFSLGVSDLVAIVILLIITLMLMIRRWDDWLLVTISREMALVAGINVDKVRLEFLFLLSLFLALTVKVVGFFFVTALLVIPSATAGIFANSPIKMVISSALVAVLASTIGISASWVLDIPLGPTIILSAVVLLVISATCALGRKNQ